MKISQKSTLGVVGIVAAALSVTLVSLYCSKVIPNNKSNIIPVLFGIVLLGGLAIVCLVIICCCKNSLLDVGNERISINSSRSSYVSIDSHESQYLDVNDQIKEDFKHVIYKFNYLLSNIERCDVQNVSGSQFRFGNVKTIFFFPVFKTNFDLILNKLLSKGWLTKHAENNQHIIDGLNLEDYAFVCIAAKLIDNTSLSELYPLWVRNYIKVLAGLPINNIGMDQRRLTSAKIISLLGQRVYFANSYEDLGKKFAELINSIKVHGIATVEDLYKIWDKPEVIQYVEQLSQLRYFRYYDFFGADCDQAKVDLAFQILDSYLASDGMPLEATHRYVTTMQTLKDMESPVKARAKQNTRSIILARICLNKLDAAKLVAEAAVDRINKTTISWVDSSLDANLVDVQFTKSYTNNLIKRVASTTRPFEFSSAMRVDGRTQVISSDYPTSSVATGRPEASAYTAVPFEFSSAMRFDSRTQAISSDYPTSSVATGRPEASAYTAVPFEFSSAMRFDSRTQAISSDYPTSSVATGRSEASADSRKMTGPVVRRSSTMNTGSSAQASTSGCILGVLSGRDQTNADTAVPFELSSTVRFDSRTQTMSSDYPAYSMTGEPETGTSIGKQQSEPIANPLYRRMGRKPNIPLNINLPCDRDVYTVIPSREDLEDLRERKFEYKGYVGAMSSVASRIYDGYKTSKEYAYITYPSFIKILINVLEYKDMVKDRVEVLLEDAVTNNEVWKSIDDERKQKMVFCAKVIHTCPLLSVYFACIRRHVARLMSEDIDLSSLSSAFVDQVYNSLNEIEIYETVGEYVCETKKLLAEYVEFLKNGDIRGVDLRADSMVMQGMECSQELFDHNMVNTVRKVRSNLRGFCKNPVFDHADVVSVQTYLNENLEINL